MDHPPSRTTSIIYVDFALLSNVSSTLSWLLLYLQRFANNSGPGWSRHELKCWFYVILPMLCWLYHIFLMFCQHLCLRGCSNMRSPCWLRIAFECGEYVELTLSHIFNVLQAILDQVEVKMNWNVDFITYFQCFRYVMLTLSHISNVLLTIMPPGAPTWGRDED